MSNKYSIVEELVDTRINGNQIKGNETYEARLKSVSKDDINNYSMSLGGPELFGSKLEMIEQIKNNLTSRK